MSKFIPSAALLALSTIVVPAAAMSATYDESTAGDLTDFGPGWTLLAANVDAVTGSLSSPAGDLNDRFQMTLPTGTQILSYVITAPAATSANFTYSFGGAPVAGFNASSSESGTITLPSSFAGQLYGQFSVEGGEYAYSLSLVSADVPVPAPAALLVTGLAGLAMAGARRKRAVRRG